MNIGFIGAGKVGFSLGKWFAQNGVTVTGYWSRRRESAGEAALFTHTTAFDSAEALVQASDVIFLTVPDGMISPVYETLRELELTEKQLCHCSGALTAREAFPGAESLCAGLYSIHPLFPISSKDAAWRELPGAFFCLEGHGPHLSLWEQTLTALGARTFRLPSAKKSAYHCACAMASNLVCALAKVSVDLLADCGLAEADALEALSPLMKANLEHILQDGPALALTGPVERGDARTVARHLACLSTAESRRLYEGASLVLTGMAEETHPETNYQPIRALIGGSNQ